MSLPLNQTDQYDWNGIRDEVLDLYGRGYSVEYIARLKGMAKKTVSNLLHSEFQSRNQNRQAVVQAHAQQVHWLKQKVTERIHAAKTLWDRRDAELLLKILEREAKLFGTDQPVQQQITHTIELAELSNEELDAQLRQFGVALPEGFLSLPAPQEQIEDAEFTLPETTSEPLPPTGSEVQH